MDQSVFPEELLKSPAGRQYSRFERWLGLSNPAGKPGREAVPGPVPVGTDVDPDPARLERWLGVDAPGDRRTGPVPSAEPRHRRASSQVTFGTPAVGVRRYGAAAVAVLTTAVVGLGALALDLRADVASLQKDAAADGAARADATRQLNETEAELRLIDMRLAEVEGSGPELDMIRTRLANLEKRLGRR